MTSASTTTRAHNKRPRGVVRASLAPSLTSRLTTIFGWTWAITSLLTLVAFLAWGGAFRGGFGL